MIYAALLAAALQTQEVERFFGRYCIECHGAEKPKRGFRLVFRAIKPFGSKGKPWSGRLLGSRASGL